MCGPVPDFQLQKLVTGKETGSQQGHKLSHKLKQDEAKERERERKSEGWVREGTVTFTGSSPFLL